uniref:Succinyl-CoA ligase alpha-chain 2 n=1 Tax=Arundo donax TaxID=35708 RepID=A0A0A9DRE5_ARUDO
MSMTQECLIEMSTWKGDPEDEHAIFALKTGKLKKEKGSLSSFAASDMALPKESLDITPRAPKRSFPMFSSTVPFLLSTLPFHAA